MISLYPTQPGHMENLDNDTIARIDFTRASSTDWGQS